MLLEWLEEGWRQVDSGIWEVRGPARHFTHSKVMAWVAFDRAVRAVTELGRDGPLERWRALRQEIHDDVLAKAWSERQAGLHAVLRVRGARRERPADAARGIPAGHRPSVPLDRRGDPPRVARWTASCSATERAMTARWTACPRGGSVPGVFVLARGRPGDAGRRRRRARVVRAAARSAQRRGSSLGAVRPAAHRMLGNFPQAFTHLAIINTAFVLSEGRSLRNTP